MFGRVLKFGLPIAGLMAVIGLMVVASQGATMQLIDTHGQVANKQRDTLYLTLGIMSIIIIPVFILTGFISFKYRDSKKSTYRPDWAGDSRLELLWWGIPIVIVAALSVVVWNTSHSLDPYRPLVSSKPAVKVQVIALQWKWLFVYPELGVASLNELAMPVGTPVDFSITSDAPMNSFWIPQLGGQIYAMSGMTTKLHLEADKAGDYRGMSANLSGEGHSSMTFTAKARSTAEYEAWVASARSSKQSLDRATYDTLKQPSLKEPVQLYKLTDVNLFNDVVAEYMHGDVQKDSDATTHEGTH
jgi:cytochrome o ubiquinol oxidase subunit 2